MNIGDTVYRFDINRRVYEPPKDGNREVTSGPIWREHWRPMVVVRETSRSWLVQGEGCVERIPKRRYDRQHWAMSPEELEQRCWVHQHAPRLARAVADADYATLKLIQAVLVGRGRS
jgi:hypothetical protein